MKSFIYAVVAATALSASYAAFAQSTPSAPTREQVRAELVQLEQAGYKPEVSDPYYPQALQAAQARVTNADETGYGAQAAAGVRAGRVTPVKENGRDSIYFGQ
ncbi:purine-nucleoside phosphorylase [Burkholderia sp. SRS-46]|nr:purine-nucleoside phosphorylase [Burkholderia sp. SRS-46]